MQKDYYSEIGNLLRLAREERRLTLEEAADRLHIRARYLHALEQGRFDELPGGIIYVKGYLRAYAAFLKLDRREILRRFTQIEKAAGPSGFYLPQVISKARNPSEWAIWGGGLLALAFYLFWLAVLKPERVEIALVEPVVGERPLPPSIPAQIFADVACLRAQDGYYPPCHVAGRNPFDLLPQISGEEAVAEQMRATAVKQRKLPWFKSENETDE